MFREQQSSLDKKELAKMEKQLREKLSKARKETRALRLRLNRYKRNLTSALSDWEKQNKGLRKFMQDLTGKEPGKPIKIEELEAKIEELEHDVANSEENRDSLKSQIKQVLETAKKATKTKAKISNKYKEKIKDEPKELKDLYEEKAQKFLDIGVDTIREAIEDENEDILTFTVSELEKKLKSLNLSDKDVVKILDDFTNTKNKGGIFKPPRPIKQEAPQQTVELNNTVFSAEEEEWFNKNPKLKKEAKPEKADTLKEADNFEKELITDSRVDKILSFFGKTKEGVKRATQKFYDHARKIDIIKLLGKDFNKDPYDLMLSEIEDKGEFEKMEETLNNAEKQMVTDLENRIGRDKAKKLWYIMNDKLTAIQNYNPEIAERLYNPLSYVYADVFKEDVGRIKELEKFYQEAQKHQIQDVLEKIPQNEASVIWNTVNMIGTNQGEDLSETEFESRFGFTRMQYVQAWAKYFDLVRNDDTSNITLKNQNTPNSEEINKVKALITRYNKSLNILDEDFNPLAVNYPLSKINARDYSSGGTYHVGDSNPTSHIEHSPQVKPTVEEIKPITDEDEVDFNDLDALFTDNEANNEPPINDSDSLFVNDKKTDDEPSIKEKIKEAKRSSALRKESIKNGEDWTKEWESNLKDAMENIPAIQPPEQLPSTVLTSSVIDSLFSLREVSQYLKELEVFADDNSSNSLIDDSILKSLNFTLERKKNGAKYKSLFNLFSKLNKLDLDPLEDQHLVTLRNTLGDILEFMFKKLDYVLRLKAMKDTPPTARKAPTSIIKEVFEEHKSALNGLSNILNKVESIKANKQTTQALKYLERALNKKYSFQARYNNLHFADSFLSIDDNPKLKPLKKALDNVLFALDNRIDLAVLNQNVKNKPKQDHEDGENNDGVKDIPPTVRSRRRK